jgi:DNA-binding transcriptional LysR family regulator
VAGNLTQHICRYHRNITLSIIQAHSGDLKNLMNSGHLDVALTYRTPIANRLCSMDLFSERLVLVSGSAARESGAAHADLAWRNRSKAHSAESSPRIAQHHRPRLPDEERHRRPGSRTRLALDAVKAVLFKKPSNRHTILPYHSVWAEIAARKLSCAEFEESEMQRTIAIVTPKKPHNAEAIARLCERLRTRAAELGTRCRKCFVMRAVDQAGEPTTYRARMALPRVPRPL